MISYNLPEGREKFMLDSRGQKFIEIMNKIKKLGHKCSPYPQIPHGEFMILASIDGYLSRMKEEGKTLPGIKVSELSKSTHSSVPATSKVIRHLEEKKLVERIADEKDRRVVYVALTQAGEGILSKSKEQFNHYIAMIIGRLGTEDADDLIRICTKLYDIMYEEHMNRMTQKEE